MHRDDSTKPPLVSIIVNCYNGEAFLRKAIDSILAQTYQNFELVFWDNQSTDSSARILQEYVDPRIKYFMAPTHEVLYHARNLAFKQTTGSLVAFLDVDDWWDAEKLEMQVTVFCSIPSVTVVYSNYWIVKQATGQQELAINFTQATSTHPDALLKNFNIGLPVIMLRKDLLKYKDHELFDSRFNLIGDFDLMMRLAIDRRFFYINHPLAYYRIHGNNETKKSYKRWADEFSIWQTDNAPVFGKYNNFRKISEIIVFHNALDAKFNGSLIRSFKYLFARPICLSRCRLAAILLTPRFVIDWVRKRA